MPTTPTTGWRTPNRVQELEAENAKLLRIIEGRVPRTKECECLSAPVNNVCRSCAVFNRALREKVEAENARLANWLDEIAYLWRTMDEYRKFGDTEKATKAQHELLGTIERIVKVMDSPAPNAPGEPVARATLASNSTGVATIPGAGNAGEPTCDTCGVEHCDVENADLLPCPFWRPKEGDAGEPPTPEPDPSDCVHHEIRGDGDYCDLGHLDDPDFYGCSVRCSDYKKVK